MKDIDLAKKFVAKSQNAASRGISFGLSLTSYRNLLRAKKCHYTGVPLNDKEGDPNQRTIDRIDSSKGYEKGNVVACASWFNQLKGTMEKDKRLHDKKVKAALVKMIQNYGA